MDAFGAFLKGLARGMAGRLHRFTQGRDDFGGF